MEYKIVKIKTCNGNGAMPMGIEIAECADINRAFSCVATINNHTACDKHGGKSELCECEYEVQI